ncbi:hypothetical protein [Pelosinus propionicus]|uniref:Uncharacterized protein n=1 Tax=Pelosinus propionicus DSM 13327 TaxID=1123291 RepID=A0A1I4N3Q1_9FIRM|nr:hypothetical protein [Pelosinus propionicus]SFM09957.1 hypothetical protein SAMN04490355_104077 [Pelosinus propionicus DSM 13327]
MEIPLLMTPREFAKYSGMSEHVIREKCILGLYPHTKSYSTDGRPFLKVLVSKTLAIIEKECLNNAPFMAKEKPSSKSSGAVSVMAKALKYG